MIDDEGAIAGGELPSIEDLKVERLGGTSVPSPLIQRGQRFADEAHRVLLAPFVHKLEDHSAQSLSLPSFEPAGPRRELYFEPRRVSCGIVTCGGLCPGLNDVIRSIVLTLRNGYGVARILGFRYGYKGLSSQRHEDPLFLEPDGLKRIHQHGGTILGTSRGPQDLSDMVDTLMRWRIDVLFAVGGDGTLRGASALWEEIKARGLKISVVGVPKTIDNDLMWVERSFGFATAVEEAQMVIRAAHSEAEAAWNGIGLVKLMGRYSGFIAASATLTNGDVDFCLIPEVPFTLSGSGGFLEALDRQLEAQQHAVVVVAEGAGQRLLSADHSSGRDASGNIKLKDIGLFLKDQIGKHLATRETDFTIKYIDPSYTIRSLPANSIDSAFCLILGQHAVHAAMAGRTNTMVGFWNQVFTHVPLPVATGQRKQIDPDGDLWQRVLDATLQPNSLMGR